MPLPRIIISGGGTGGHIFPAIAIANAIKAKINNAEFLFVGADGKMEMEKVPDAGYKIIGLPIMGLQRSLTLKNLAFPFKLIASLLKAKRIINDFNPNVAVGVGGFASGPLLQMASKKGIPCLIQEQNSYPGITNKLLAKKVQKICVAYDGLERFFPKEKIILTGNPVRQNVIELQGKREDGYAHFGLDPKKKTLLVIGGSLGARSINQAIRNNINLFKAAHFQVLWQTGKLFIEEAENLVEDEKANNIIATDFVKQMDFAYAIADVVVSRAGAIAVSELCLVKKPCILVPFPFAAEDHQTKNAQALVDKSAAILIKDKDATAEIPKKVFELFENEDKRKELEKNIAAMGINNAADKIADEVLKLIA